MPAMSASQKAIVSQFVGATGASERTALRFLRNANFKLDVAADAYFNSHGSNATTASTSALDKMFDGLKDEDRDSNDFIGVESSMGYLSSLEVNMESAEIFVVFEIVQAPSFGEITRKGFVDGWRATGVGASKSEQRQYIRQRVAQLSSDPAYFKKVYRHAFTAGKEGDQKALDLDRAVTFWAMMFAPPARPWVSANYDWLELWKGFLAEKWTRSVNRDMWNQALEFANKAMDDETLSFWSEDGAWPSVIDDFVAWFRARKLSGNPEVMELEH